MPRPTSFAACILLSILLTPPAGSATDAPTASPPASLPASLPDPARATALQTQIALNTANIDQIIKQNQVSIDDRQALHALVDSLAATELAHYNAATARLDIGDAKVMTIGWVLGVLFTVSQGVAAFLHFGGKRKDQDWVEPWPQPAWPPPALPPVVPYYPAPVALPPAAPSAAIRKAAKQAAKRPAKKAAKRTRP